MDSAKGFLVSHFIIPYSSNLPPTYKSRSPQLTNENVAYIYTHNQLLLCENTVNLR